jgi:hypothetical protein
MDISDYFESLQRSIRQNHTIGFLAEPIIAQAFDTYRGLFRGRIFFWDGSHLTIDEIIDTEAGYPEIVRYSYTYVKDDKHIFRYDNAPHYPELANFPHHKHIGPNEIPEASEPPTLSQIFREIEQILTASE